MHTALRARRAIYLSIAVNAVLALLKGLAGYFGNSFALVADAIESTSDIFVSFVLLVGMRYATRPADKNHPYGHGRSEALFSFLVALFLVASAVFIGIQSIHNIQTPHASPEAYTLWVLAVVVICKELFSRLLLSQGRSTNSTILTTEAWHQKSDALSSGAAFVGVLIAVIGGKGFEAADDWAALAASGIIFYNAYLIFRPALGELMDEHVHEDLVERIRELALEVEGVEGTEKCLVRKSGMQFHIDLHARVNGDLPVRTAHEISHSLKRHLLQEMPQLADVLIHIEPA